MPLQFVVTQVGDIAALLLLAATLGACAATDEAQREPGPVPGSVPMIAPAEVRHVSVSIDRSPADVYAFCADPHNLPRWAAGLATSVRFEGEELIAASPMGEVRVRFAARNALGVLDHDVTLPSGVTIHNPMRVVPNGRGSEVVFTLIRQAGMSAEDFERDAAAVARDLNALKRTLEA